MGTQKYQKVSYHWRELSAADTNSMLIYIIYDNTKVLISVDGHSDFGMGGKASYKCLWRLQ